MNELGIATKRQVIKLFLQGFNYRDIEFKLGISHGSVVYIIDEFREGDLTLTQYLNDYIDVLRKIAVDLRKSDTSISEVLSCLKIHNKVRQMAVEESQVEAWLDTCRQIASNNPKGRVPRAMPVGE